MKPNTISKILTLKDDEYYKVHMELINPILPVKLSPKEIEVLSAFMSFDGILSNDRFSTTGKSIVRERLKLSHQSLSNYIISLAKKGFLVKDSSNKLQMLPILFPDKKEQIYLLKLIKHTETNA